MEERDYYKLLGVERDATDVEIKKAFRKLVHQHHPDKHKGDKGAEEKFKKINEAYEVLKDPNKRGQYDRFGYVGHGTGTGESGYGADFGGDFGDLFGDVFSDFFGGGRRGPQPERGMDLRYDMELTFNEAAFGTEQSVKVPKRETCSDCSGSGAQKGTQPEVCPNCRGAGQIRVQQGFFSISRPCNACAGTPCNACAGTGRIVRDPCPRCVGAGITQVTKTISVKVPPGVDTGSRLRITGEGEPGRRGGPPGDLYIMINVAPHQIFQRRDDDIICEVPVSFTTVALGSEIEVPTLEGRATIKIPAGTQTGKVFRLKNKGIASLHTGRRGDLQVVVKVETPSKLTERQKELLDEFAVESGEETSPMKKNFFSKVKEMFE
jgi:molecular chaperone DnaJ